MDKAITAAEKESGKSSAYVSRLRRERLPLEHVWLKGYDHFKQYAETKGVKFAGPDDPLVACKQFFALCEQYEVTAYREYDTPQKFADYKENMLRRFEKPE